jgi:hypothetical protein
MRAPAGTLAFYIIGLTAVAAACSGHDNGTSPNQPIVSDAQIESDVATAAAGEIASDIADYSSADTGGANALMFTAQPSAATVGAQARTLRARTACTENASAFQLVYGGGSDTLSIDLTWYYFGAGLCQSAFSSTTTDSITYTSVDSLHINASDWTAHVVRDRAYSVNGSGSSSLTSDTAHVWSGVGQGTDTSTYSGSPAARSYGGAASDTAVAITYVHPRAGDIYPLAGTVSLWYNWTLTVTGANAESVTVVRHVVATLNGTNDVPLAVFNPSSGALELTCTLDLAAHRVVSGSCH